MRRRYVVKGRDVHDAATGRRLLLDTRANAIKAARGFNEDPKLYRPDTWRWIEPTVQKNGSNDER